MHDQIEKKKTENILHFLEASYKTIAHFQSANGQWTDQLLKLIKNASTIEQLIALQTDDQIKNLSAEIILNLAGIKLLKTKFKENIKEWRFVAAKGIQRVKDLLCNPDANIDALLDKLILEAAF